MVLIIVTRTQRTRSMIVALCLLGGWAYCSGQVPTKPKPKEDLSVAPMAKWDADIGSYYGMSEQRFDEMGLSKLTADQFEKLRFFFLWREMNAKADAQKELLSTTPIAHCSSARSSENILVFVNEPGNAEAEFSSALRRNLRAIPDVGLTYDEESADIGMAPLLEKDEATNGRIMGYSVAVAIYDICEIGQGASGYIGRLLTRTLLYTSDSLGDLAGKVAAIIDSKDIEEKRKLQSSRKSRN
jgi:hypothetical protein